MRRFGFLLAAAFFLSLGLWAVHGYEKDLRTNTTSQEFKDSLNWEEIKEYFASVLDNPEKK